MACIAIAIYICITKIMNLKTGERIEQSNEMLMVATNFA